MPKLYAKATPEELIERRRRSLAPLFAFMVEHSYHQMGIIRQAYAAAGVDRVPNRIEVQQARLGRRNVPWWFVRGCCAAMERSVEEVMGREWIAEFGVDFGVHYLRAEVDRIARIVQTA